jgi:hypothetical protein
MANSKYPNKIDTSIEIPAVRDNIAEIGSEVINSVRTAIFQIEKTLGINPQGAVGNTVSSRINRSIDSSGNIKKEALSMAGVLSGPLSDKDISKTAAINERKLNLDYPTTLLQEEISQLTYSLNIIEDTLDGLASLLAVHVHPSATNRHPASAISVDGISDDESSTALKSIEATSVQGAFEGLFSSHINYDGTNTTSENRSHDADQLFFDKSNISSYISSDDVQGAIEDGVLSTVGQLDDHQADFHSSSISRKDRSHDPSGEGVGRLLLSDQTASFSKSTKSSDSDTSRVVLTSSPESPLPSIEASDTLTITESDVTAEYQISNVNYSPDGLRVESIDIYGRIFEDSFSPSINVYRNKNRESDFSELLIAAREYQSLGSSSYSNADIIQISNPDAVSVVSKNCRPSEISLTNRYIKVSVDGSADIELDLFDSDLESAGISQNIESILKAINSQISERRMSIMGYRVDYDDGRESEIAIVHRLPTTSSAEHTISVKRGSDDCLDSAGLSHIENMVMTTNVGQPYHIMGQSKNGFREIINVKNLDLVSGTSQINVYDSSPTDLGVRVGHTLTIFRSLGDDGTYTVISVTNNSIIVDRNQLPGGVWSSTSGEDSEFIIYSDSSSLNGLEFRTSLGLLSSASIVEIFLDLNRNVLLKERLSYGLATHIGKESLISPCKFDGDVSLYTEDDPGNLYVESLFPKDSSNSMISISLDGGKPVIIDSSKNKYLDLYSGRYNLSIKVFIKDSDTINSKLNSDGAGFSIPLYGSLGVNNSENLVLGQALYLAGNSRISGFGKDYPRIFSTLRRGAVGALDIGSDLRREILNRPHLEKRSNGVFSGLEVTSVTDNGDNYVVSISSGTCYVRGKRIELPEELEYITDVLTGSPSPSVDKFYIAINEYGKAIFSPADPVSCGCTLDPSDFCILGSAEYSSSITVYDLRLFLDNLDFKVLNSITVSPQDGMGHFSEFGKAIKYAKRFSEIFPEAGIPTVHLKSGVHRSVVNLGPLADFLSLDTSSANRLAFQAYSDMGLWLNFPIKITGEGSSTVLDIYETFSDLPSYDYSTIKHSDIASRGRLLIAGQGLLIRPSDNSDVLTSGSINISSLSMDHSSIWILDPAIKDSDLNKSNFNIELSNIAFDLSKSTLADVFNIGLRIRKLSLLPADQFGNISIRNCEFYNNHISIDNSNDHSDNDLRNISLIQNTFRGNGTDPSSGEDLYAVSGGISPLNISSLSEKSNIQISGNIIADNDEASATAYFDSSSTTKWGDRTGRNLYVSGDLCVGTSEAEDGVHTYNKRVYIEVSDPAGLPYFDAEANNRESGLLIVGRKNAKHTAFDDNEILARNGDSGSDLHLNLDGEAPVRVARDHSGPIEEVMFSSDGSSNFRRVNIYDNYADLSSEYSIANLNIRNDDTPGIFLSAGATPGQGDFATYYKSTTNDWRVLSIGAWDIDEGLSSYYGTNFHERFRLRPEQGRLEVFQQASDSTSGVRLHKQGTHGEAGDDTRWTVHFRDSIGPHSDVLGFHHRSVSSGINDTRAYIRSDIDINDIVSFTGQHRVSPEEGLDIRSELVGYIVSSTGEYNNLSSGGIKINEALPIISLSISANDKRVFGVISDSEDINSNFRSYSVGAFVTNSEKKIGDERFIVNSIGEGGIWISNVNGELENGDYITTSNIPGIGMRQNDDLLHNYTVAKITCDCDFDLNSKIYKCEEFEYNGVTYKKAFVGCTYHCG